MSSLDLSMVTEALKNEGLEVDADEQQGMWSMSFEFNAREQRAMLSAPNSPMDESISSQYLLAVSFIESERLQSSIEELSALTLRTVIKTQAEVLLAKFDYWTLEGTTYYVAVSSCSIVNWDGPKLRIRLEACAELASRIRAALFELGNREN